MSNIALSTSVSLCEDTTEQYELVNLLAQAGYTATNSQVLALYVQNAAGNYVVAPADSYLTKIDADTVQLDLSKLPNYNGSLPIRILATDAAGALITLDVAVTADPVNDAPEGADNAATIDEGASYVFSAADFGFVDSVEGDAFAGVVISTVPAGGQLQLSGATVSAGDEISPADLAAGNLVFVPDSGFTGPANFSFQVRDDGGVDLECGGSDLDLTPNTFIITVDPVYASLGDRVWNDTNANGVQDAGETGRAGVTVELYTCVNDAPGALVASTTTDADGNYNFAGLVPGDYIVQFIAPNGTVLSTANVGDDAFDSDADIDGLTGCYTLTAGENNTTVDAGLIETASLGDRVWIDANTNGVQDAGELGKEGINVQLFTCVNGAPGELVAIETTDANGNYSFTNIIPGDYIVQFVGTDGTVFTTADVASDAFDSDADANGFTGCYTLTAGENNTTVDAGVVEGPPPAASLGDRVWNDTNANGVQDAGETGRAGVSVELYTCVNDAPGALVASTATDADGNYSFTGLMPGDYIVKFIAPNGTVLTTANVGSDAFDSDAGADGFTGCYTLAAGENNPTVDAGVVELPPETGSIGDRVWNDTNANGVQDAGETGRAGVTVNLYACVNNAPGALLATETTDANGNYTFANLVAGDYILQFVGTDGTVFSTANVGDDAFDSDVGANGLTGCYTLGEGEHNTSVDAGVVELASLGDRVWNDTNANGVQDAGETGRAGVSVELYTCVNDAPGALVASTATDADGNYSFTGLMPGDYIVKFVAPDGTVLTSANVGSDALDSDADGATGLTGCYTLAAGENNTTVDAGVVELASLGDRVWNDTNANGVQDAGETGRAGVSVELYTCVNDAPGALVASTATDADGNYSFTGLMPGDYIVKFVAPDGTVLTSANVGSDALDSDADGATGLTGCYTLAAGENNTTVDAGLVEPGQIDIEKFVRIEQPGELFEGYVCETYGKATALTFDYQPGTSVNTEQDAAKAAILSATKMDDDGLSWVVVSDKSDPNSSKAKTYFAGYVAVGDEFTATAAAAGESRFGSSTYVHFYDDNPNVSGDEQGSALGLLQSLTYHTSCSQPIKLGDTVGNVTLTGYSGENGTAPSSPPVIGPDMDADTASTGPIGTVGVDTAVFTYHVTNLGTTELSNVQVSDDRLSDLSFVGGDTDGDGRLDVGETWVYTASETVASGLQTNIGTVTATSFGVEVTDSDAANYIGLDSMPMIDIEKYVKTPDYVPQVDMICETLGKPLSMTFDYRQGTSVSNTQEGKAAILGSTKVDDDGLSWVVVSDNSNGSSSKAKVYFAGYVAVGDEFTATVEAAGTSKFGSNTYIHFYDDNPNVSGDEQGSSLGLLQSLSYHTSCSKPINLGDVVGNATLVGYTGEKGSIDPTVWYGDDADTGPGPDVKVGDTVEFTYVVTNPGEVALGNVVVTDDRLADVTFVGGDTNGDGLLDAGEKWIYTASEIAASGTTTNTGTVTAAPVDAQGNVIDTLSVSDSDDANYNGTEPSADPACATLVGATWINEGSNASYMVQLDKAVDHDVWFKIQATDGSAHRVDTWAGNQDIIWGGYYDYYNSHGRQVIYDRVPNGPHASDGDHAAVGPDDASWDYTVYQNGVIQSGGDVWVKVSAGETSSNAFEIEAWKEKVTIDLNAGNADGYNEGTETFTLKIVSDDSDAVDVCEPQLDVCIGDRTSYVTYSPIVLDLDGNGIQTTALGENSGRFDLFGSGTPIESGWISGGDAFLAVDTNGNGRIDDISELFGGSTGQGFAKLASFDSNGDGLVDASDARFGELMLWQDANENHQTDAGELRSLAAHGVESLKVSYDSEAFIDDNANLHLERSSATLTDGSTIDMVDVYFNAAPSAAQLGDVDLSGLGQIVDSGLNMDALLGTATTAAASPAIDTAADFDLAGIAAMKQLADTYDQPAYA